MSRTLNKAMLIGNVGRDPELKHTPSGIPVISFRLATSETWKDRDNNLREHTDWHTVVAWRGLAEVVHKLVQKGSRVYIEGKIQTRTFDDKLGNKRHVVEILADNLLLLDNRKPKDRDGDYEYSDNDDDDNSSSYNDDDYKEYNSFGGTSKDIPF
jgi:single-strand DNA-binding protein